MEKETSIKLANELRKVGFEVEENFGGYGIGILKMENSPTILYRTDMDALPMEEKTDYHMLVRLLQKILMEMMLEQCIHVVMICI